MGRNDSKAAGHLVDFLGPLAGSALASKLQEFFSVAANKGFGAAIAWVGSAGNPLPLIAYATLFVADRVKAAKSKQYFQTLSGLFGGLQDKTANIERLLQSFVVDGEVAARLSRFEQKELADITAAAVEHRLCESLRFRRLIQERIEVLRPYVADTNERVRELLDHISAWALPPLEMPAPPASQDPAYRFHYTAARGALRGRGQELDQIERFLADTDHCGGKVCWWLLTGPGGSGKSRLALKICRDHQAEWDVGFLETTAEDRADTSLWKRWNPGRPTLIVIDYVASRPKYAAGAIVALAKRCDELDHPVRLLLLERDFGDTAEWWRRFYDLATVNKQHLDAARYGPPGAADKPPLRLSELDDDALWEIMIDTAVRDGGGSIDESRRAEILAELRKTDPQRRPLYAMFAGEALADQHDIRQWDELALTRHVLEKEQKRWRGLLQDEELRKRYERLLLLVTLGYPVAWSKNEPTPPKLAELAGEFSLPGPQEFKSTIYQQMCGVPITGEAELLPGLEPDVLGECFVLDAFERVKGKQGSPPDRTAAVRVEALRQAAWKSSPNAGLVALRAARDFPGHPAVDALLALPRLDGLAEQLRNAILVFWSAVVAESVAALLPENAELVRELIAGLPELADRYGEAVPEIRRHFAGALFNRGVAYGRLDPPQWNAAIADYAAVIEMPDAPAEERAKSLVNRGVAYGELDPPQWNEAIADWTAVIDMDDVPVEKRARALLARGLAYGRLDPPQTKKTIADWTAVIEMADAPAELRADALINRGVAYGRLDPPQRNEAIADYAAVIDMPDAPAEQRAKALVNRGLAYSKLDPPQWKKEIDDYTAVIEMPNAPAEERARALVNRGVAYGRPDPPQWNAAIADYAAVIDMPDAPAEERARALVNRGAAYSRLDPPQWNEALADYATVIDMPDAPAEERAKALYNRGVAYSRLDPPQWNEVIADWTAVIKMPDAPAELRANALFNRGVAYGRLDPPQRNEALADWTAVIEMPDAPAEERARALFNRGVAYSKLDPPQTKKEIDDYTAVIDMPDAPAEERAGALLNRGLAYVRLDPPQWNAAIADWTAVIDMDDAPAEQRAKALVNRGVVYGELDPPQTKKKIDDYTAVIDMPDAPAELRALARRLLDELNGDEGS